jgi:hypothetical protein
MRWAMYVSRKGAMKNSYGVLVGDLEGNAAFGRSSQRCKDSAKWIKKQEMREWRTFV